MLTWVVEKIQRSAVTEADEAEADYRLSLIAVSAARITKKPNPPPPGTPPLRRGCTMEKP